MIQNINEVFGLKIEDKFLPLQINNDNDNLDKGAHEVIQQDKIHSVFNKLINSKSGEFN